jgi:prominin 1
MKKSTRELIELSESLGNSLKFGGSSFKSAIENFLTEIRQAEQYIKDNGTRFVKNLAEELSNSFLLDINKYLDLVVSRTKNEIGKCGPLANAYDSMVVAGCSRIIDPFVSYI